MKHLYISIILLFVGYQLSLAQCTPNAYNGKNHGLVLPDSANFPHTTVNAAFNATLHLQVAQDTSGNFTLAGLGTFAGKFKFDSITIRKVTTNPPLPNGATLTYYCSPSNCRFLGGNTGCVNLSATAINTVGVYKIVVDLVAKGLFTPTLAPQYATKIDIPQTITKYNLIVDALGTYIDEYQGNFTDLHFLDAVPNPTSDKASIKFISPNASPSSISLIDLQGKIISSETISSVKGLNTKTLDLSIIPNGIYFLNIENQGKTINTKLVVQH